MRAQRSESNDFSAVRVKSALASDIDSGFSQSPRRISSRWFYDAEGSRIFSRIMELEEYYLTRAETEILRTHSGAMADVIGTEPLIVVELGAGDGRKTKHILQALMKRVTNLEYRPIDVSGAALEELCSSMKRELPDLRCRPVIGDNLESLDRISAEREGRRLCVLFIGSSIGNSHRSEMEQSLEATRSRLQDGDMMLVGFDLLKDPDRLIRAYSDGQGVTRDFNLNLLKRLNRELGAQFDLSGFRHYASWNPATHAMESWLISLRDQDVPIKALGKTFCFRKWEAIHTETSLKFAPGELAAIAARCGFHQLARYQDSAGDFADVIWLAGREI